MGGKPRRLLRPGDHSEEHVGPYNDGGETPGAATWVAAGIGIGRESNLGRQSDKAQTTPSSIRLEDLYVLCHRS